MATVLNMKEYNTIRILDETPNKSLAEAADRAFKAIESQKPKGFMNKLTNLFKPKPVIEAEVKYNGITMLIGQHTKPIDIGTIYNSAKNNAYIRLSKDISELQDNINSSRDTNDFTNMSKYMIIANNLMMAHNIEDIPPRIKENFVKALESTGLTNRNDIKSPQASHLGFLATQMINGVQKNSVTTLDIAGRELAQISTKFYDTPNVKTAAALDNLANTIGNFNVHKLGFQNPDKFIDAVAQCVDSITNDDFMAEPLKRKCTDRMLGYLKAAGFESSTFNVAPDELNQSSYLKHQVGQLMRAGATYNYDQMAYAPALMQNYNHFPAETKTPSAPSVEPDALEAHIARSQEQSREQSIVYQEPQVSVPSIPSH